MDNNGIYKYKNFTISQVTDEDRIEYFETLEKEFIGENQCHTIQYIGSRQALKQEVKRLYTDLRFKVWVIKYKNKFIGFFHIEPPTDMKVPVAKKIYILKKFRKSKAIVCVLDFVVNYLYPNRNIQVERDRSPGFEKLLIKVVPQLSKIAILDMSIKDRIKKIIGD